MLEDGLGSGKRDEDIRPREAIEQRTVRIYSEEYVLLVCIFKDCHLMATSRAANDDRRRLAEKT